MTVGEITFDLSFGASPFLVTLGDASGLAPLPIPSDDAVARFQAAMNRGCESGEGRGDSRLTALADIGARPKEVVPASENPSRGIPVQTDEETEDAVVAPLGGRPLAVEDARDFSGRSPVIDAFAARERADAPIGRIVPEAPKRPIDYLLAAASRADLRAYREVGVPDVVVTREVREVREGSSLAPAAASVSVKDSTVSAVPGSAPAADAPKSVEQTVVIVEKKAVVNAPAIDVPVRDAEKPAAMEAQRMVRESSPSAPAVATVSIGAKDKTIPAAPGAVPAPNVAPAVDAPKSVEQTVVIVEKKAVVNVPTIDVPVRDAEKSAAMEVQRTVRETPPSAPAVATVNIGAKDKTIPAAPGAVPAPNVAPAADAPKAVEQTVVIVEKKAVVNAPAIDVPVRDAEKPAAMEVQRTVRESSPSAPAVATVGIGAKAKTIPAAPGAVPAPNVVPAADTPKAVEQTVVVVEEKAVANAPTIDVPVRDAEKPAAMEGQRTVRESLPSAPAVETDGLGGKAKAVSAVPESHSLPEATLPTAASKTGVPDAAPVVASPGAHAIMPEHDPDDPETVTAAIQAASSPIVSLPSEMPAAAPEISAVSSAVAHAETTVETIDKIVDAVTTQMVVTLGSVHGEGNVRIILKPTVLDGSEISMTAKDGALSVAIMPATPEAARLAAAAMPRLETALAEHVSAFRHVAVAIVQRKSK